MRGDNLMALDCLILAAGAATRFGSCKLLANYQGKALIDHAILAAQGVSPRRTLVVSGASHSALSEHLSARQFPALELAYCADWQLGMGHSLAFGVSQFNNDNPLLILLGDQPRVSAEDLHRLYQHWCAAPDHIACASFADTLGVPAIFPADFKTRLRQCEGDRGAKALLLECSQRLVKVPLPAAEFDVDRPQDLPTG